MLYVHVCHIIRTLEQTLQLTTVLCPHALRCIALTNTTLPNPPEPSVCSYVRSDSVMEAYSLPFTSGSVSSGFSTFCSFLSLLKIMIFENYKN